MKSFVIRVLQILAAWQIHRFTPTVIAVTGSVGKTSVKNAIALALGSTLNVRTAHKNYNNEFGVPLAILGEYSPGKNAWGWVKLFACQIFVKKFPDVLVLEFGADKPGDIQASCAIAMPTIGVMTAISPVHVSNYPDFGALIEEKATLVKNIPRDGLVVLNADDVTVAQMRKDAVAPIATYGVSGHSAKIIDVYTKITEEDSYRVSDAPIITKASIVVDSETVNLMLRNAIGPSVVTACSAALVVAKHLRVPLEKAVHALNENFSSGPGRMRPLLGIKGCLILDDSYNAAPASVLAGLDVLALFKTLRGTARRIAVLGTMAELGQYSEEEHSLVARKVANVADIFVATGEVMQRAADEAIRRGMNAENVIRCADSVEAGRWLDANVRPGDIVFVKGSQSARMEKAVKDILAEPLRAEEFLCRQEKYWVQE